MLPNIILLFLLKKKHYSFINWKSDHSDVKVLPKVADDRGREVGDDGGKKKEKKLSISTISCEKAGHFSRTSYSSAREHFQAHWFCSSMFKFNSFSPKRKVKGESKKKMKHSNF